MKLKNALMVIVFFSQLTLSAAFTPEEARRVYGEVSSSFAASSQDVGDYVFMNVEWNVEKDASPDDRETLELSAVMDAVEKYVAPSVVACTNSPFSKALTSWMTPQTEFKLPEVQSTVVKDEEKDGMRRQVVAFDAVTLKAARSAAAIKANDVNKRTSTDWLELLKNAWQNFKSIEERRKFNVMLGCPIVNFILCSGKYEERKVNEDEKEGVAEIEKITKWKPAKDSVYYNHPGLLWSVHKNSDSNLFYPSWQEDDGGKFAEAESLYLKGKDVPKILGLLVESICANPIGEKKWQYLGSVLKALNKDDDAMIAYIQALKFNRNNMWAWKGVLDVCRRLNMKTNAAGLEWYFKLNGIK